MRNTFYHESIAFLKIVFAKSASIDIQIQNDLEFDNIEDCPKIVFIQKVVGRKKLMYSKMVAKSRQMCILYMTTKYNYMFSML